MGDDRNETHVLLGLYFQVRNDVDLRYLYLLDLEKVRGRKFINHNFIIYTIKTKSLTFKERSA